MLLDGKEILVNNRDNPEKQRFSIAHEIFHFLMNEGDNLLAVARQGETWKKKHVNSDEAVDEEIADYFAANLLIPTERFVLWEDKPNEEIAHAFGVEVRCIQKRREEIEYELELMIPKNLSSDVEAEDQRPLSLDEMDQILEAHSIHDNRRV
jgi:Zn-dependent peptidase ImmA (M78 family)